MESFIEAANNWRRDATQNRQDLAIFYFVGHGFEITRSDPVLLLSDFGSKIGPAFRSTVRVENLFRGMGPMGWQPDVARKQLFFIDTSRDPIEQPPPALQRGTSLAFDAETLALDDRSSVVIYASDSGGRAYGLK